MKAKKTARYLALLLAGTLMLTPVCAPAEENEEFYETESTQVDEETEALEDEMSEAVIYEDASDEEFSIEEPEALKEDIEYSDEEELGAYQLIPIGPNGEYILTDEQAAKRIRVYDLEDLFKTTKEGDGVKITGIKGRTSGSGVVYVDYNIPEAQGGPEIFTIPDNIDGKPVVAIGSEAFKNVRFCKGHIPKVDKKPNPWGTDELLIVNPDYYYEIELKVSISDSVKKIGDEAFSDAGIYGELKLPNNPDFTKIAVKSFKNTDINMVTIPDSVATIENSAFYGCHKLYYIKGAKNVTKLSYNTGSRSVAFGFSDSDKEEMSVIETFMDVNASEKMKNYKWDSDKRKLTLTDFEAVKPTPAPNPMPVISPSPAPTATPNPSNNPEKQPTPGPKVTPAPGVPVYESFSDVDKKAWYIDAVQYVIDNKIMSGLGNGKFGPNENTTRAQVVEILYNCEGRPAAGKSPFKDAQSGWYRNSVAWAYNTGIAMGITNDTFEPNRTVTREQIATFLFRYAAAKKKNVSARGNLNAFPDAGSVSKYAKDAVSWTVANGIISGRKINNVTQLVPAGTATRAEIARVIMVYQQKFGK